MNLVLTVAGVSLRSFLRFVVAVGLLRDQFCFNRIILKRLDDGGHDAQELAPEID